MKTITLDSEEQNEQNLLEAFEAADFQSIMKNGRFSHDL